jgi:isocitrate dehydrogenase kinase/phosphatase
VTATVHLLSDATPLAPPTLAALIAEHFQHYNDEFGNVTRRAATHFQRRDWAAAQLDAVARIELYEQCVARCRTTLAGKLRTHATDVSLLAELKREYEAHIQRRPDSDFYRTFFNSITRDLCGTVGVNPDVEFCATSVGRAPCPSAYIR